MKDVVSPLIPLIAAAALFLGVAAACTTEKTVYVLPDGTEVTPTTAQATQMAGGSSQTVVSQPIPTSIETSLLKARQSATSRPTQPAPVVNPRWNDRRNTLCSSLGLDASLCEKIALNQTGPEGDEQDIDLPDEPDATPCAGR